MTRVALAAAVLTLLPLAPLAHRRRPHWFQELKAKVPTR